jgi:hypothetical protein
MPQPLTHNKTRSAPETAINRIASPQHAYELIRLLNGLRVKRSLIRGAASASADCGPRAAS